MEGRLTTLKPCLLVGHSSAHLEVLPAIRKERVGEPIVVKEILKYELSLFFNSYIFKGVTIVIE